MELENLTIKEVRQLLDDKKITVRELVDFYLGQISEKNVNLNTYLEIYPFLEKDIDEAQNEIDVGESKPLTGIPISIKDNILVKGKIASAASKILEHYKATYTSGAAQKLLDQKAVLIGRTNMDEFAMGGSTENSAYGVAKNPHDLERVSGGSSGGSAASVASAMAMASLGSDTGGSIRQPASFCGVVGLKPTYGSVSRSGLIAMASSLDIIGPITKTVEDSEIVFNVIKGKDPLDSTSVENSEGEPEKEIKKIGVPRKYLEGADKDVLENFEKSLNKLQELGVEIIDIDLPSLDYSLSVYYVLMPAEVSSNMARYDGVKFGSKMDGKNLKETYFKTRGYLLGEEVKRRIMLGTYVLSAGYADQYYNRAWQVRNLIKGDLDKAFSEVDLIALPTSPTPAFKIGEKTDDPISMYLSDIYTVFANLTGVPAISIPDGSVERENSSGESKSKLPTGLQLVAPHLCESRLFQIGKKFEKMN